MVDKPRPILDIVIDGRGLDRNKAIEIADGRIYTAKQALDLDLIDEIDTFKYQNRS